MAIKRIKQAEVTESVVSNEPTIKDATDRILDLKTYALTFAGKTGYNPYLWIAKNLAPYITRIEAGETSPTLIKSILSIPKEEPKV